MDGMATNAPTSTSHPMAQSRHGDRKNFPASLVEWMDENRHRGVGGDMQGIRAAEVALRKMTLQDSFQTTKKHTTPTNLRSNAWLDTGGQARTS